MKKKMLIGGQWKTGAEFFDVNNRYNGSLVAEVPLAAESDVTAAVTSSLNGLQEMSDIPPYRRAEILHETSKSILKEKAALAETITAESGKPIKYAVAEVERSAQTFQFAAEEAKRIHGETIPMGAAKGSENRSAFYERFPVGVIGAITPFNFPINLVAHKVAPAIAAGNSIVLKPAEQTPLTALKLGEILLKAGLPGEAVNIITGDGSTGAALVSDNRLNMITFTGSPPVGREIKANSGLKKVTLELGSNSGVIIEPDADINAAVSRSLTAAFANSGQVCISLQRIYIHEKIYDSFKMQFLEGAGSLKLGDPMDPETDIGPLIDGAAADRTKEWLDEAVKGGAKVLAGGNRMENIIEPTVLSNINREMRVYCAEVFAPVVSLMPYKSFEEAINGINDSKYGLQAGVYTNDVNKAFLAFKRLDVGGVMINDVPTYRADHMPYGGIKESGLGREGLKYSIEEMTEIKTMVFNL